MKIFQIAIALLFSLSIYSQKPAYVIYNAKGKKVGYKKMLKDLSQKDIVLFGELHNNAIAHWLELEVTKDIHKSKTIVLGAEMLEADNQTQVNNYLNNIIDAKALDTVARLWPNYKTDYAPLVNYAKENKLPFIATNIPRRYANLVYKKGFSGLDSLSTLEKSWIAPLPIIFDSELPTYKNILKMMGDHGTPELVMAQAIKDATMAHFILKNYKPNTTFIHYNGAYHSNNYEGILWYLKNKNGNLNYVTISTVNQEDITKLKEEHLNVADYIICVDADMTTTY
ncbi:MAG: ChaN family lipoprotein [Cellulophaga sp.]|uniref:ChaN family lipoprotein n=1 Tax=unclassified Cellulophaga TaxID=2634405 RepID=UPI0026E43DD7|nr:MULTISPECIES: ChaN family lipoprotein [unclassified Cellulophaga]MDO6492993.1 ChaN family lipoprotein [Cellulophaga sp. 2_MG-2023]MDO6496189.1 ChaN family lipoprotein [Cellulophaga sp. 3_MG-2023]